MDELEAFNGTVFAPTEEAIEALKEVVEAANITVTPELAKSILVRVGYWWGWGWCGGLCLAWMCAVQHQLALCRRPGPDWRIPLPTLPSLPAAVPPVCRVPDLSGPADCR